MTDLEIKLKSTLNAQQYAATMHVDGPAVVMAGAGSGKTHTLINRVAHLIDIGVAPEQILMLTFTNAAANEMKDRASKLLDDRCANIYAATYHSFCTEMLRKYGRSIGLKNFDILTPSEYRNMISYVKSSNAIYDNLKGFPTASQLEGIFSMATNKRIPIKMVLLSNEKYVKYCDWSKEIELLSDEVAKYAWNNGKLTFDDILFYMNKMLSEEDSVTRRIANTYKYIMVDEFQDTNILQERILLQLANYNKNIVVVGDISQSIYAFRGANVSNLKDFDKKFDGCKTIILSYNYRSTQQILDAANDVMHHNVRSWNYFDMVSPGKFGDKPYWDKLRSNDYETGLLFDLIKYYHENGIAYSDMAVLAKSSRETFELENCLTSNNIHYRKLGGAKFMDLECVGDILAYFHITTNPHDLLSWYRVLKLHPSIGDKFAKAVAEQCNEPEFLINNGFGNRKFYSELRLLHDRYKQFRSYDRLDLLFDDIVDFYFDVRDRYVVSSRMNDDNKEAAFAQIESDKLSIATLKDMSKKYDDIISFVDGIALDSVSDDDIDSSELFTISTIHSSKGLEWKVVFIMNCVEGIMPMNIGPNEYGSEKDEEELRCLYVAITRAKEYLHVIVPEECYMNGKVIDGGPSHYIASSQKVFDVKTYN